MFPAIKFGWNIGGLKCPKKTSLLQKESALITPSIAKIIYGGLDVHNSQRGTLVIV